MDRRKIAVVTYDLWPGRERLMPWRTLLEVTHQMRILGHDARLVSINVGIDHPYVSRNFDLPLYCCPTVEELSISYKSAEEETFSPELVYWPVTWCSGLKTDFVRHPWDCATVVYHGGCCYNVSHVSSAMRYMSLQSVGRLLVETFVPKHMLIHKLRKRGVCGVLCMTELTKRMFERAGWSKEQVIAIPPGLPDFEGKMQNAPPLGELDNILRDRPYVLFLGNPLPIRGIDVLISASRKVFAQNKDSRIVCLLRPDPGEEMTSARERVIQKVKKLGAEGQFICVTKELAPHEIRQSIINARAVVMPFLFIPSEIPLGILEAMQLGTPVITTQSGGTSDFLGDGGWVVPPGNATALGEAIIIALHDVETRRRKAAVCFEKMANHPTWATVGDAWLEFGLSVLNRL